MSFAFKRFNFFQPNQVHKHAFPPNACCVVPGGPLLWVGTESGAVCILDSRLSLRGTFNAHGHKVLEVLWLERLQLLVTVGVEEPGCSSTTVKLWPAEKALASAAAAAAAGGGQGGGAPDGLVGAGLGSSMTAVKTTRVFGSHGGQAYPESPVTAAAVAEGLAGGGATGGGLVGVVGGGAATVLSAAAGASGVLTGGMLGAVGVSVGGGGVIGGGGGGHSYLTVALGLASGHAVVLTGDVAGHGKARLSHYRRLSARSEQGGDRWSVTGLELTGTPDLLSLFVVTESQTVSFNLQTNTKTVLDPQGAPAPRCCCLRPGGGLLTVARQEGLYDYTADTRAGCTVFEGPKQRLAAFGRYLVVVTRDDSAPASSVSNLLSSASSALPLAPPSTSTSTTPGAPGPTLAPAASVPPAGASGLGLGAGAGGGGGGGSSCLQLADVRTKLLAGTFVLQGLCHVFCAWGQVHAVTAAGAVWSYKEADLATQLEALLRRSLYKLALDVARAWGAQGGAGQGADAATLASIHQRWGDHLYSKGDYDGAMGQYLETVGFLEPSAVIRRFLDAQRIHNLTAYLELMHERGLATCDHTTLLLNCYTKLKDVSKLDAFIRRGGVASAAPGAAAAQAPTPAAAAAHPHSHAHGGPGAKRRSIGGDGSAHGGGGEAGGGRRRLRASYVSSGATAAAAAGGKQPDSGPPPALSFDADTAVRVLRGAGYAEHALWVADAAGQVDAVLDILLDDLGDAAEAIAFLETLPRKRRSEAVQRYGKALINLRPEEATRLIMDLCTQPQGQHVGAGAGQVDADADYVASVADFSHLYSDEPTALMLLCEFILNTNAAAAAAAAAAAHHVHHHGAPGNGAAGSGSGDGGGGGGGVFGRLRSHERLLYHTLLELYLAEHLWKAPNAPPPTSSSASNPAAATPEPSSAAAAGGGGAAPQGASPPSTATPPQPTAAAVAPAPADPDLEVRRAKALELLSRGWPSHAPSPAYDPDHALVLCRLHAHRRGLLFLYDRMRLPREALQVHMACGDHDGLINAVLKYGDASRGGDPVLWSEVLEYFVAQHDKDPPRSDCSRQITKVIEHVERSGVLPPLVVLQTLSRSRRLPLSLVRAYVGRALQRDTDQVNRDHKEISTLAAETAALREEVTRLRTQPRVFQNSRCSASGAPLELPVVHFLCGHSYNARQLGDGDRECPLCAPDQQRVLQIRRNMQAASLHPDRFFTELREAADGFSVVAEAFGRGLMNVTPAAAAAAAAVAAAAANTAGAAAALQPLGGAL